MTRTEIEKEVKAIADDVPFTMPFFLAGLLLDECLRQGLKDFGYHGPDYALTLKIKRSPKKRLGAAGAQKCKAKIATRPASKRSCPQ